MKLTVIGNNWFPTRPGGLDRYIYGLIHQLASPETSVNLYGLGVPSSTANASIQLTKLADPEDSLGRRIYSSYCALRALRTDRPDAINIHFALYGLSALPHLPQQVPITCNFHGPWAIESQKEGGSRLGVWLKQQLEQLVYGRCDRFIVLSQAFGQILHREYGVPWNKIHIIPGGVDIEQFQNSLSRRQARDRLGWPQDRFVLFTPRRLVHRMGLDTLLRAISRLKATNQAPWLAIAGKGPLRSALEQQAIELNLGDSVMFLGYLSEEKLPIAYQAADLTVMPSQSLEGFGLVLLESLASGTPTLCTPVGGMPEAIADFSPELIADSTSVGAIASSLEAILTGSIELPDRVACRNYAASHFSWPTIANRVKQVLLK